MLELNYITNGNADPHGKPRVYFTCHPSDVGCLERISCDLYKAQDCAVYFCEDMSAEYSGEDRELVLGQMSLFVIPVSVKLLTEPNRAMDRDYSFAVEQHIPVLPIMLQPGLDQIYARPDKFGDRQYLDPNLSDITMLSYSEKLKKYLSAVLIDDETADRVRSAFDAYIFLSYRKKDRKYANELMRSIHDQPEFRDVAIWFDEYITLGESFQDSIAKALSKSALCTLLVTPNLVNESNYVQTTEYPMAKEAGKPILPVEVVDTDRETLQLFFPDIPDCIKPNDAQFHELLLTSLQGVTLRQSNDPTHNYLIGLAYLEGIDVEKNPDRAFSLIISAAEEEHLEAMITIYEMYHEGKGVPLNYQLSTYWAFRLVDYYTKRDELSNPDTFVFLNLLTLSLRDVGVYQEMFELCETVYALSCKVLGKKHRISLTSLNNLAISCGLVGDFQRKLELNEENYTLRCEVLGEKSFDAIMSLNNVAESCGSVGDYQRMFVLSKQAYTLICEVQGKNNPVAFTILNNVALAAGYIGDYQNELALNKELYYLRYNYFGATHPETIKSFSNLACSYCHIGDHTKSNMLMESVYALSSELLGEKHPTTLVYLENLVTMCGHGGHYSRALELAKKGYTLFRDTFGEKHPDTIKALNNLACSFSNVGEYHRSLELTEKVYCLSREILGEMHPDTLGFLNNLAQCYGDVGNYQKQLELNETAYTARCKALGDTHPDTIVSLINYVASCGKVRDYQRTMELGEKAYAISCEILGKSHDYNVTVLTNLIMSCGATGEHYKQYMYAKELYALGIEKENIFLARFMDRLTLAFLFLKALPQILNQRSKSKIKK